MRSKNDMDTLIYSVSPEDLSISHTQEHADAFAEMFKDGRQINTYVLDPVTGIGTDNTGNKVNLPPQLPMQYFFCPQVRL